MVLLWRLLRRQNVERISGFKYLKHLLGRMKGEGKRDMFWILPTKRARAKISGLVAPRRFLRRREELSCRTVVRIGSRRSKSSFRARAASACPRGRRDWQRRPGKARLLFARKFVVSAGDPLHRRGARFPHGRSDRNSRLGGPILSRLALAIVCAAAHFHPAIVACLGTAMVDLEIR